VLCGAAAIAASPTLFLRGDRLLGDRNASALLDVTARQVAAGFKRAELEVYEGAPRGLFMTHMRKSHDIEGFIRE
jgi:hypothetical protein